MFKVGGIARLFGRMLLVSTGEPWEYIPGEDLSRQDSPALEPDQNLHQTFHCK
jgi:hypothetical protein